MSKSVVRIGRRGKGVESRGEHENQGRPAVLAELLQGLIPIGLEAVNELLQQEVSQLAGERYRREGGVPGYARWGGRRGSIYLADQKVALAASRVRDMRHGRPGRGLRGDARPPPFGSVQGVGPILQDDSRRAGTSRTCTH